MADAACDGSRRGCRRATRDGRTAKWSTPRAARSSSPATCARTSRVPTIPTPSSKTARRSSRRSPRATRWSVARSTRRAHTTQPPARYTEASLVKELEERGIGRPSTYASVIDTLLRRDYVWKKGTALVPSWSAFAKQQLLERHFAHLIDYEFTATMEEALDAIARGEAEAEKWLHTFWFGNGVAGPQGARRRRAPGDDRPGRRERGRASAPTRRASEIIVRVWSNGASVVRGDDKAPVPVDLPPDELTIASPRSCREGCGRARVLGNDPETGMPVLALTGRYGPFVQLGEMEDGSKEKPKRASLFRPCRPTRSRSTRHSRCSRCLASSATSDGEEITALNGRYGPYLGRRAADSRSLDAEEQLFTVTLAQAEAIFAQPKQRRGRAAKPPIAALGPHPESGARGACARRSVRSVRHRRHDQRHRAAWYRAGSRSISSRPSSCLRERERAGRREAAREGAEDNERVKKGRGSRKRSRRTTDDAARRCAVQEECDTSGPHRRVRTRRVRHLRSPPCRVRLAEAVPPPTGDQQTL